VKRFLLTGNLLPEREEHRQPETRSFRVAAEAVRGPVWTVEPFQNALVFQTATRLSRRVY
jgi:hypothetical protein